MHRRRRMSLIAGFAALALAGSSVGVVAQDEEENGNGNGTGYAELDEAMGEDQPMAGAQVTIQTQWIGGEGENFRAAVQPFIEATGITVAFSEVPSGQHETLLRVAIEGGAPPDIAQLAQPSAVLTYGVEGALVDVSTFMDAERLQEEYPATIGLYSLGGGIWGIPYKVDVKSTVWYPINAFEEAGYEVPETWDDLIALSDQIVEDGSAPWCIGMDAGPATGWIATDWVEDVMLRTAGVEAYGDWITGDLPFDSEEVRNALDYVGQIFFTDGYVFGGPGAITATSQVDAMDPMFNEDLQSPDCWMQKQATWYGPDFFPDAKATGESQFEVGEDVGLFYFPPIDEEQGTPALGAGDAMLVFNDRPEVRALAQYLATPQGIEAWIEAGAAISANQTTPAEWYEGNYKLEVAAGIVADATAFGFDASDLMPPEVGAGSFWNEMVNWIQAEGDNTDEVVQAIDASWPGR
jgi:alpha-glucoside transport system substrate-binding protein